MTVVFFQAEVSFMFVRISPLSFFCDWNNMVQTENVTSWPVSTPACLSVDSMLILFLYSLWVLLNSHTLWIHWNSVLMGHHQSCMRGGGKSGRSASGTHTCMFHCCPIRFHYKTQFRDKIIKNSKMMTGEL